MQAAQHNTAINQPFVDAHTQSKLQELKVLQRRVFQIRKTLRKAQTNQLDKSVMRDQNKGASNQEGRRATQTEAGSLQIKVCLSKKAKKKTTGRRQKMKTGKGLMELISSLHL
mmetsp:Transcript_16868/g.40711  ORF Transcript_16868/g.40711 Transcript_16868/m.40711 type:complete len:113 (-) Transcript_16868:78-416(-)